MSRALTNKFLHGPSQTLNQAAAAERAEMLALYQRIYDIPDSPDVDPQDTQDTQDTDRQ